MSDTRPLVWLPFPADRLGDPPADFRYELVLPDDGAELPQSVSEVEFYVPPYPFGRSGSEAVREMTSLRVVQTMTAGVEHIRPFLPERVILCNGRGVHDASTAELAIGLILSSTRGLDEFVRAQERGEWKPRRHRSLADSTVLILGHGAIGEAIERRLDGFETTVVRVARTARPGVHTLADLPRLLPDADVVVLVLPLTEQTRGLVDREFLAAMKDDALLVNVARGAVVDTDALTSEVRAGRVRAALDVTDPEPLPAGHPLWSLPGVLVTPHVAGGSPAMWPRAYRLIRGQLERFANGEPLLNVMEGDY